MGCLLGWVVVLAGGTGAEGVDGPRPPLKLARTVPLPGVRATRPEVGVPGRIDHLAYDPATQRLFVAALFNWMVEAIFLNPGQKASRFERARGGAAHGPAAAPGSTDVERGLIAVARPWDRLWLAGPA